MGGLCSTGVRPEKNSEAPLQAAGKGGIAGAKLTYNPYPKDYDPPFPIEAVGTFSNHGIEPDIKNNAVVKANQDRGSVDYPLSGDPKQVLLCCLDGHGRDGHTVSQFVMEHIHAEVEANEVALHMDPVGVLRDAFENADTKLKRSDINSHSSGTSAVAVYMRESKLWIANAGDSRAVLGQRKTAGGDLVAHDLTWDQKPDHKEERKRIESMAGIVTPPEAEGLSARVWTQNMRYGLSMARSIGDHLLAKNGVIATPEVESYDLQDSDEVMILATDGIWEFIDSQMAVNIVSKHTNATEACFELIYTATKLWRLEEGDYRDDITAIVVMLKPMRKHMEGEIKRAAGETDIFSPTSKDLRKKRTAAFPDGTESPAPMEAVSPSPPASVNSEKAKTFRKRRLSLNPHDDDLIEQARRQHQEEAAQQGGAAGNATGSDEPVPPKGERKRRLSISPDMDPTGQKLVPKGMA